MKLTKKLVIFLVVAILFVGCSQTSSPEQQNGSITVTDMAGREIKLQQPAARIVAVSPSDVEILYALGAEGTIIGRGKYCDYPEDVLNIPAVESGADMNMEQVMMLEPEVVLITRMNQSEEQMRALESAGAKVVVSDAADIVGVYASIELIGTVVGKVAEAKSLVDNMKQSFADIEAKAAGDGGKTVYFEVSPLEHGLWTAGRGTFMDELAAMLGLANAFADVDGWGSVSEEQVIQRDPDYIVTITMYFGEGPEPVEEILSRTGWENMKAIQNGTVLHIDNDEIARPGPRLINAADALYEFIRG